MIRAISAIGEIDRFLDLGCGSGILSAAILDRFPDAAGTLVDFSGPMLKAAQEQLSTNMGQIEFIHADLASSGWSDRVRDSEPFDAVVSGYAIHHFTDARKKQLFVEIHEHLRAGGIFINVEHVSSSTPWVESLFEQTFVDSLHDRERNRGGTRTKEELGKEYYHREDKKANILATVEVQCQWLREIGYQDVDCYFKILELAVFGGRRTTTDH
jgi:ubiquinone/menaquinone biosynthesis C-methylase UbiE